MTPEFSSYTKELAQIKESLRAPVEPNRLSFLARLLENAARIFHLPWYQDEPERAQKKLNILKGVRDLEIKEISDKEWHARIYIVNEKGVMDTVFLAHKIKGKHVGRSQWSHSEYSGGRVSRQTFRFNEVNDLVNTYGWVIEGALKQRAKNIS